MSQRPHYITGIDMPWSKGSEMRPRRATVHHQGPAGCRPPPGVTTSPWWPVMSSGPVVTVLGWLRPTSHVAVQRREEHLHERLSELGQKIPILACDHNDICLRKLFEYRSPWCDATCGDG